MYDLEAIRARVTIRELAEEAGAVFRGGASRCVLHGGDNPQALHLYDGERRWHCFTRCEVNDGDVFSFWQALRGVTFGQAVAELAERAGQAPGQAAAGPGPGDGAADGPRLQVAERKAPPGEAWMRRAEQFCGWSQGVLAGEQGRGARAYLGSERGLWDATVAAFGLGYCPRDYREAAEAWGLEGEAVWLRRGIVIPGRHEGRPWYVKVRRPVDEDGLGYYVGHQVGGPKFSGPRGGRQVVFGADLWQRRPSLLLCEGEWDCMAAWQAAGDWLDVGSLGGATARLDLEMLARLTMYPLVMVVSDADEAGERARAWWLAQAFGGRVRVLRPPAHDLSAYWQEGGDLGGWLRGEARGASEEMGRYGSEAETERR